MSQPHDGLSNVHNIYVFIGRPASSSAGLNFSLNASSMQILSRSYPGRFNSFSRVTVPRSSTSSSNHARAHASRSIASSLYGSDFASLRLGFG
jgi:hypothetical protein